MNRTLARMISVGLLSAGVAAPLSARATDTAALAQNEGASEGPSAPQSAPTKPQDPVSPPEDQPGASLPYRQTPEHVAIPAPPPGEAPARPLNGPPPATTPEEQVKTHEPADVAPGYRDEHYERHGRHHHHHHRHHHHGRSYRHY